MANRLIGNLEIARVHELFLYVPTGDFFPDTTDEDWAPHKDWLIAELRSGRILREGEYLDRDSALEAAGLSG